MNDIGTVEADDALVEQLRHGNRAAASALVQRHNRGLWRIARSILRDDLEAEEAVQETYIRAFTGLDAFRGESSLSTWLSRIAVNEALRRRAQRRPTVDVADLAETLASDHPLAASPASASSPEQAAARAEIRRMIERAVDTLPAPFRTVFMMRVIEQTSLEETSACLGIGIATVKTRLHRANRLLRLRLGAEFATVFDDAFPFAGRRCEHLTRTVLARLGWSGPIHGWPPA